MKITKKDLLEFISKDGDLDHVSRVEVVLALQDDELEIEGYERSDWARFDPNDPKTFPPSGGFLGYFTGQCGDKYQDVYFRNNEYTDEEFATRMAYHKLTHWCPLPNPPVEME